MDPLQAVFSFLSKYKTQSGLLALSGGVDSMCLFWALLQYCSKHNFKLHIAHVDHGWREESQIEAEQLRDLVLSHNLPFHLRRLDPKAFKGNLEAACRELRYQFFREICQQENLEGVFVAHQQNDLTETILKRICEGASLAKLEALKEESQQNGLSIWRPLLKTSRKEIELLLNSKSNSPQCLGTPFQDPSNHNTRFLRTRLRHEMIPWLNQKFGKQVESGLLAIAADAQEVSEFFQKRSGPLLESLVRGVPGIYADWQSNLPDSLLEIKYLLRFACERQGFYLSRQILEAAAHALLTNKANLMFSMGKQLLLLDRKRLFLVQKNCLTANEIPIDLHHAGIHPFLYGTLEAVETPSGNCLSGWKTAWQGKSHVQLPSGQYRLAPAKPEALFAPAGISLNNWWKKQRVPFCLRSLFPVIWKGDKIVYEFLTESKSHSSR